jgi:hypothetical protein
MEISKPDLLWTNGSSQKNLIVQNCTSGVMFSVFTSSVVDSGFELQSGLTIKIIKSVFVTSLLSTQH